MTQFVTIDRATLEQVLAALGAMKHMQWSEDTHHGRAMMEALRAALANAESQEPHVWMIQGSHGTWKGEFAEMDAKAEAARCGGTCYAYPLFTAPQAQQSILKD